MDLANDKVGGTQILQVQILVFESDSLQPHLLGFELSGGDYSHSGTNLYHHTFVRRSVGFKQTEANLKPLLIWCHHHAFYWNTTPPRRHRQSSSMARPPTPKPPATALFLPCEASRYRQDGGGPVGQGPVRPRVKGVKKYSRKSRVLS